MINLYDEYEILDVKEKVTIADSFVLRKNKIGSGNGEAKLYIGQENEFTRNFFGKHGFKIKCFLLKQDIEKHLADTKEEYFKPTQEYKFKNTFESIFSEKIEKIKSLDKKIFFEIEEQTQIEPPRIYVKSLNNSEKDKINYELLRYFSLPNFSYISILKLKNKLSDEVVFYFRLFADITEDVKIEQSLTKEQVVSVRKGQQKYRNNLLKECPFCPITMVSDERILIASHIKPWRFSDNKEKIDPKNGFMLTPTYDKLFDKGFISFSNDKKVILSPFLSPLTYKRLNLKEGKIIDQLPINGREKYLKFHREHIFKI